MNPVDPGLVAGSVLRAGAYDIQEGASGVLASRRARPIRNDSLATSVARSNGHHRFRSGTRYAVAR